MWVHLSYSLDVAPGSLDFPVLREEVLKDGDALLVALTSNEPQAESYLKGNWQPPC